MFRYSVFLALYFLLKVRFEWREATIARYVEPFGHFISIFFPLVMGSLKVKDNEISPVEVLPGWCGVSDFPPGCSLDDEVECKRGARFGSSMIFYFYVSFFIIIFIAMLMIILKVRQTELRMRRYAGGRNRQLEMTNEAGKQALLYIGVFFLTFFPLGLLDLLYKVSVDEFCTSSSTF
jgi:membrane protein insertase Oxa1/YidC/SpoIIIJ